MAEPATSPRLLFVDDEVSIRMTLPPVLQKAGFDVRVAENVSDALFEINSNRFDVLISDLNIGEEGDGFLVTSAMRHVQPDCVTFILTGYPAFETALQAIHNHVDDYLVKPVDLESLIRTLTDKVRNRGPRQAFGTKRVAGVLRQNQEQIIARALGAKQNGRPAEDSRREFAAFLNALIEQMEAGTDQLSADALRTANEFGKHEAQAHSAAALAAQFSAIEDETLRVLQSNMNGMDISGLMSDVKRLSASVHSLMKSALQAYEKPTTKVKARLTKSTGKIKR